MNSKSKMEEFEILNKYQVKSEKKLMDILSRES